MASTEEILQVQKVSDFIEAYDFEIYDILKVKTFLVSYRPVLYITVLTYLLGIYFGQKYMRNRPAFKLNNVLFLWNISLSIFSIISTFRSFPEFSYNISKPNGMYKTMCTWNDHNYATSFWGLLFLLSKFVELGDTAFIVLRKQKLIFLHWFHHVATLVLCWVGFSYYDAIGRIYFINTFVHSFMYTYYALSVLKVRIPRRLAMVLTTVQILQMFFALSLNFVSMYYIVIGEQCGRSMEVIFLVLFVVAVVVSLFINFFVKSYLTPKLKKLQ